MKSQRVLLVGHSHANCVASAVRTKIYLPSGTDYQVRVIANGAASLPGGLVVRDALNRELINPVALKSIQDHARLKPAPAIWLVSILGGNHASRLSLFRQAEGYWMSGAGQASDHIGEGTFLPEDLMVRTIGRQLASLGTFFGLLSKQPLAGFVHIESPPPVRDPEHIFRHLPQKTLALAKGDTAQELGAHSISDAHFRLRAWQSQSHATRRLVEDAGGHYLPPPAEAVDADGFLAEQYWADAMHASQEYGALVLRTLEAHILLAAAKAAEEHP
jgi:hypothetical protein